MDTTSKEKLSLATKTKLGVVTLKNTATISVADNLRITKVLTVCAKPVIENITSLNAEVKFDGIVEYNLLVVLENNEIVPITQKSPFNANFENSSLTPESLIIINSNIIECNNTSNSDAVTYMSLINFDVYEIKTSNDLCCAEKPGNVFVKENEICYNLLIGKTCYDTTVNFELAKDSKVSKILFVNNNAYIKSVIPSNDYFVISGEVVNNIIYQDENSLIKSEIKETSFTEEIEFKGITKETIIQASVLTKETTVVENTEKNAFMFDVPIKVVAQFFTKNTLNCIVDAYSLTNEINLTTSSFTDNNFFATSYLEENIITNFALTNNMQPIDKILSVTPTNIQLVNVISKNGELLLEGLATINIIYYFEDDDNNNILNSLDVEIPYSLQTSVPEITENCNPCVNITISDVNVKNKRGRELEILAEVKINYNYTTENISCVTSSVSIGEEKPPKDYALEVYLAKENQSIWDIAKELNISSQDLLQQNPNLTLPIKQNEKIIAYTGRKEDADNY